MLNVQKFLIDHGVEELERQFFIKTCLHPVEPLMILNYNQLESPKTHPIVRECRGLVLNRNDYSLVAKSMNRFFNWGELQDEMDQFDFTNFSCQTKEDGSLVLIYYWNNNWFANTRGSFATDLMQFQNFTWGQGFLKALNIYNLNELDKYLDRNITYICEFCSLWNKVVRSYPQPIMYSLTGFSGYDELSYDECEQLVSDKLKRPDRHHFSSLIEIQEYINEKASSDQTYEGVVIRDIKNLRYKIKSSYYLGLHNLRNNNNIFNPKNILPFILSGEKDELLTYFEEVKEPLEFYEQQFYQILNECELLWNESKNELDQKSFALKVKDSKMSGVLFQARKTNESIEKILRNNPKEVLKHLILFE